MKPFHSSDFVVTFYSECSSSKIVTGWDEVLRYIDREMSHEDIGYTVRSKDCEIHDVDRWNMLNDSPCEDYRHTFEMSEFGYCVGLSIIRITIYERGSTNDQKAS